MSASKKIKIGIIAGGGDLPRQLAHRLRDQSVDHCILGIKNHVDQVRPDQVCRIGEASKIICFFKMQNVTDIVFIGSVMRPSFLTLWPDRMTLKFFIKAWIKSWGDNNLLQAARNVLEGEGFRVRGIHEFLPELLMPSGILGKVQSGDQYKADIQLGLKAAQLHGRADKGQAVLVKDGHVIAKEGKQGTSAMIRDHGREGAILIKTCKPQQDVNLDLPTLGSETVTLCVKKKMAGIVGQAGRTLLVDQDKMIALADKAGLFLMGAHSDR